MGTFMFWVSVGFMLLTGFAIRRQLSVGLALVFASLGEVLGIYVRYLLIHTGADLAFGPGYDYIPDTALVNRTFWYISLFNFALLFGVLLVFVAQKAVERRFHGGSAAARPRPSVDGTLLLRVLAVISAPGVLLLMSTLAGGGTLVANSNLEASRIDVSGEGPIIFIKEFPLISLLVWFAYKRGRIGYRWMILTGMYTGLALLSGNRSKMVTVILIMVALLVIQKGYKVVVKRFPIFLLLGVAGFYLGWIIIYARGSLMKHGGSFYDAVIQAVQYPPAFIFAKLYRGSFNGFDGFLSIISNVPQNMGFSTGRFWYESATILIPRAIWPSKWSLPITNIFTNQVWKWEKGGIFVTGPGVLYLDSGLPGIILGAVFFGIILTLFLSWVKRHVHPGIADFFTASTAFFMCRFVFAGGSNDVVFLQRLIIGGFVIIAAERVFQWLKNRVAQSPPVPVTVTHIARIQTDTK